jgi:hypothetical protein
MSIRIYAVTSAPQLLSLRRKAVSDALNSVRADDVAFRADPGSSRRRESGERLYGSNIDVTKGRKGKNTARTVALSQGTMAGIKVWKTFLQHQDAKPYLFPSETSVTRFGRIIIGTRSSAPS